MNYRRSDWCVSEVVAIHFDMATAVVADVVAHAVADVVADVVAAVSAVVAAAVIMTKMLLMKTWRRMMNVD
jgi:hypothetical protein